MRHSQEKYKFGWLSPYEFAQYWSIELAQYSLSSNACNDSHALLASEGRDRAEVVLVVVVVSMCDHVHAKFDNYYYLC